MNNISHHSQRFAALVDPRRNMRGFITALLIIGVLGIVIASATIRNAPDNVPEEENQGGSESAPPYALLYGVWGGDDAYLRMIDISTGSDVEIGRLPENIKHVRVFSPSELIYIADTDESDRGSRIDVLDMTTSLTRTVLVADTGYQIDDYVISENHEYIATWEVSPGARGLLVDGRSRVYGMRFAEGVKHVIYDEEGGQPVHYPRAVTNSGRVFMDTFQANDGVGWAHGMSVSDYLGATITEIPTMPNGTYSSQPILSPDESKLIFIGYDGDEGDGGEIVQGVRRAFVYPNTIEYIDTTTYARGLMLSATGGTYSGLSLNPSNPREALVSFLPPDATASRLVSFGLDTNLAQEIYSEDDAYENAIAVFDGGGSLTGMMDAGTAFLGNLGPSYSGSYSQFSYTHDGEELPIATQGELFQYIDVIPVTYLADDIRLELGEVAAQSGQQLKMGTFAFKPSLAPDREEQQSGPEEPEPEEPVDPDILPPGPVTGISHCRDVSVSICNEQYDLNYAPFPLSQDPDMKNFIRLAKQVNASYGYCVQQQIATLFTNGSCYDSPLYLYGPEGLEFSVHVETEILNPNAPYHADDGFMGMITDSGLQIAGSTYESLEFGYVGAKRVLPPRRGVIASKHEFAEQLRIYAKKLGLQGAEIEDLVRDVSGSVTHPYIFIAHYSDAISKEILPLAISPQPDNYYNVVFYFKNLSALPRFSVAPPEFEEIVSRDGFTAIEISHILE